MFSTLHTEIIIFATFNMSSANAFNLVWSKILSCGNGLRYMIFFCGSTHDTISAGRIILLPIKDHLGFIFSILEKVYNLEEEIELEAVDPYSDDNKAPFYRQPAGLRRAKKHEEKEELGKKIL